MRHAVRGRQLNRSSAHRLALRRNLVQSLIEHGQVRTTITKAREVRSFAEKLVTLAIDGGLAARQRAEALLNDRAIIPKANQEEYDRMTDAKRAKVLRSRSGRRYRATTTRPGISFTADSVIHKLFADVGPRFKRRNESRGCSGGYTRIIKLPVRRIGDGTFLALLQFVGEGDAKRPQLKDKTTRRRKSEVRYAFYAGKALPHRRGRRGGAKADSAKPAASGGGEAKAK
jgi:large subunit ribosomal protein L17